MNKKTTYLKIKLKHLAAEAKIIRKEEGKALGTFKHFLKKEENICQGLHNMSDDTYYSWSFYHSLTDHRKNVVGTEARATNIAYGFLRDRAYHEIEVPEFVTVNSWYQPRLNEPDWKRVAEMVLKYGNWSHISNMATTKYGMTKFETSSLDTVGEIVKRWKDASTSAAEVIRTNRIIESKERAKKNKELSKIRREKAA